MTRLASIVLAFVVGVIFTILAHWSNEFLTGQDKSVVVTKNVNCEHKSLLALTKSHAALQDTVIGILEREKARLMFETTQEVVTKEKWVFHFTNHSTDDTNFSDIPCYQCGKNIDLNEYVDRVLTTGKQFFHPACYDNLKKEILVTRPFKTRAIRCASSTCGRTAEILIRDTKSETIKESLKGRGWQPIILNDEEGNCYHGMSHDIIYSYCPNCREDDY